jgi:hypothetical protein
VFIAVDAKIRIKKFLLSGFSILAPGPSPKERGVVTQGIFADSCTSNNLKGCVARASAGPLLGRGCSDEIGAGEDRE